MRIENKTRNFFVSRERNIDNIYIYQLGKPQKSSFYNVSTFQRARGGGLCLNDPAIKRGAFFAASLMKRTSSKRKTLFENFLRKGKI